MSKATLLVALLASAAPADEPKPVADFTLPDATGSAVTLSELVSDGPAVIVFYRGGWCPYCNLTLRTYQSELLPELPLVMKTLREAGR